MNIKTVFRLLCALGIVGCCVWSCSRIQSHSEIPEIHFKEIVVEDRLDTLGNVTRMANLTFSFIDGDGDLGVRPIDIALDERISKIYYTWYEKMPDMTYDRYQFADGNTTIATDIPYEEVMNKYEAQNKVLKGTIQILFDTPKQQGLDTMRVEFYITDRANHQSNIEYTSDFSILNTSESIN